MGSTTKLIAMYKELYTLTHPKCGQCEVPFSCCKAIHCHATRQWARDAWGIHLPLTSHFELPLMGPEGCTAPPHLRPHCTYRVCDSHMENKVFRDRIKELYADILEEELNFYGVFR